MQVAACLCYYFLTNADHCRPARSLVWIVEQNYHTIVHALTSGRLFPDQCRPVQTYKKVPQDKRCSAYNASSLQRDQETVGFNTLSLEQKSQEQVGCIPSARVKQVEAIS